MPSGTLISNVICRGGTCFGCPTRAPHSMAIRRPIRERFVGRGGFPILMGAVMPMLSVRMDLKIMTFSVWHRMQDRAQASVREVLAPLTCIVMCVYTDRDVRLGRRTFGDGRSLGVRLSRRDDVMATIAGKVFNHLFEMLSGFPIVVVITARG